MTNIDVLRGGMAIQASRNDDLADQIAEREALLGVNPGYAKWQLALR
jgi:hypothetical protein